VLFQTGRHDEANVSFLTPTPPRKSANVRTIFNDYVIRGAVYLLYNTSKEYNLEIATKKTKVFVFVGTDHLRTKIIINDETLE